MSLGRFLAACAASLAIAGTATVAYGMSRAADQHDTAERTATPTSSTSRPAALPMTPPAVSVTAPATSTSPDQALPSTSAGAPTASPSATRSAQPSVTGGSTSSTAATHAAAVARPAVTTPTHTASRTTRPSTGQALPLPFGTGNATQVITVTAGSTSGTTATLQAWTKVSGGWRKYGSAVTAHVGADGLTTHPSESRSATPIGSFTLTQAFGRDSNPGTALPYFRTTPADWWISQTSGAGAQLYNTHQHCSSGCSFVQGDPNEHLYYETPYYNYAVVIDYNTRNAPGGVRLGAGSAFFLHVTDGSATAGCVAIPQSTLIGLLRWLSPGAHPRILIGVT